MKRFHYAVFEERKDMGSKDLPSFVSIGGVLRYE